jgi:hypothetical protein
MRTLHGRGKAGVDLKGRKQVNINMQIFSDKSPSHHQLLQERIRHVHHSQRLRLPGHVRWHTKFRPRQSLCRIDRYGVDSGPYGGVTTRGGGVWGWPVLGGLETTPV